MADMDDVGLDALADVPVDMGEVEQGQKDASMAKGWYTTDPEVAAVTVGKSEKTGRPYGRYFGRVFGPEDSKFGFGFSWQRENRKDKDGVDTGKPDGMYETYTHLVALYKKATGENPKTVNGDLIPFLTSGPFQLHIVVGANGGNFLSFGNPFRLAQ